MSRTPHETTSDTTGGNRRSDGVGGGETSCRIHATAIAVGASGVIIKGASGRGKSSLALRALARAPNAFLGDAVLLIADDQVEITRNGTVLRATVPAAIAGQLEVRGVGIVSVPCLQGGADIRLIVRLTDAAKIERMPPSAQVESLLGQRVAAVDIDPADPAAVEKILIALRELGAGTVGAGAGGRGAKT